MAFMAMGGRLAELSPDLYQPLRIKLSYGW
jgi:hypothetical protein